MDASRRKMHPHRNEVEKALALIDEGRALRDRVQQAHLKAIMTSFVDAVTTYYTELLSLVAREWLNESNAAQASVENSPTERDTNQNN